MLAQYSQQFNDTVCSMHPLFTIITARQAHTCTHTHAHTHTYTHTDTHTHFITQRRLIHTLYTLNSSQTITSPSQYNHSLGFSLTSPSFHCHHARLCRKSLAIANVRLSGDVTDVFSESYQGYWKLGPTATERAPLGWKNKQLHLLAGNTNPSPNTKPSSNANPNPTLALTLAHKAPWCHSFR